MRSLLRVPACALAALVAVLGAAEARAEDLSRARVLDQQGARAYAEGRYSDAIRYFEEAYRLGAPPVELWNIAKCHDRIDQPENAAQDLERYLAIPDLPKSDREEAHQMLEAIRKRGSSLTVTSSPDGASVVLDGKPVPGKTPVTTTVAPGRHEVGLTRGGYAAYGTSFEAKYGRAVIVDATLRPGEPGTPSGRAPGPDGGPAAPDVEPVPGPLGLTAILGVAVPRFGEVSGSASPSVAALGTYRVGTVGLANIAVGAMLGATFASWEGTSTTPDAAAPCGTLQNQKDGIGIDATALGAASFRVVQGVRAGALAGFGLAGFSAGQVGGDVFQPACSSRAGVMPTFLLGARAEWQLTPSFHLAAFPLLVHLQPAFDGARVTPRDASGLWARFTFALGGGFDL